MKCCFDHGVDATECVRSVFSGSHFPLCPTHYEAARENGGTLLINDDDAALARDVTLCDEHFVEPERTQP